MSDAADFALPVSSAATRLGGLTHAFDAEYPSAAINDAHAFPYSTRRWLNGVRRAALALVCGGVGVTLLLQITRTPALSIQVAILGTLLSIGGVVWGAQAIQDFLGQLIIDNQGIHQLPAFGGFSIAWDDLQRWEVREDVPEHSTIPSVRLWSPQRSTALGVPNSRLSDSDRQSIRRLLQLRAPRRENRTAHA